MQYGLLTATKNGFTSGFETGISMFTPSLERDKTNVLLERVAIAENTRQMSIDYTFSKFKQCLQRLEV